MKKNGTLNDYITSIFKPESQYWAENIKNAKAEHKNFQEEIKSTIIDNHPIPKCPICGSQSLSKIKTTTKVVKIMAFGIFGMGDNGRTWKCNDCGSHF